MKESRAASRYARALLELAGELGQLDRVSDDAELLGTLVKESQDLRLFLKSPVVNKEKKKKALREVFQGRVSEMTFRFVLLLAGKGRENILPEIIEQFKRLRDDRLGILNATVHSPSAFTGDQERRLVEELGRVTKKQPRIRFIPDPSLIGGFTVRFEDTVWDGSVRRQLELMETMIAESAS